MIVLPKVTLKGFHLLNATRKKDVRVLKQSLEYAAQCIHEEFPDRICKEPRIMQMMLDSFMLQTMFVCSNGKSILAFWVHRNLLTNKFEIYEQLVFVHPDERHNPRILLYFVRYLKNLSIENHCPVHVGSVLNPKIGSVYEKLGFKRNYSYTYK